MIDEETIGDRLVQLIGEDGRGVASIMLQTALKIAAWLVEQTARGTIIGTRKLLQKARRAHQWNITHGRIRPDEWAKACEKNNWKPMSVKNLTQTQFRALAARAEAQKADFTLMTSPNDAARIISLQYHAEQADILTDDIEEVSKMSDKEARADYQKTLSGLDRQDRQAFYTPDNLTKALAAGTDPDRLEEALRAQSLKLETDEDHPEKLTVTHANNDVQPLTPTEKQAADTVCDTLAARTLEDTRTTPAETAGAQGRDWKQRIKKRAGKIKNTAARKHAPVRAPRLKK